MSTRSETVKELLEALGAVSRAGAGLALLLQELPPGKVVGTEVIQTCLGGMGSELETIYAELGGFAEQLDDLDERAGFYGNQLRKADSLLDRIHTALNRSNKRGRLPAALRQEVKAYFGVGKGSHGKGNYGV